jgi:putative membrane protein
MKILIRIAISSIAVLVASKILPGVHVDNYIIAIWVAIVLSFLNTFIKPLLVLFTIPITLFTLGLFLIVINALVIKLADYLVDGFEVDTLLHALLFSIVLSFITWLMNAVAGKKD